MANPIPRELLFGNPDVTQVLLSPDGKWLSYLAPDQGALNVWLAPLSRLKDAKPVTTDRKGIRNHGWTLDSLNIYYIQDQGGDEDFHLHLVSVENKQDRDLTPFPKTRALVLCLSPGHPGKMLIGLNQRDARWHDAFVLDLASGNLTEVFRNDQGYLDLFVSDFDLNVRLAGKCDPNGGITFYKVLPSKETLKFIDIPMEDTAVSAPLGLNRAGNTLYFIESMGRDTSALYAYDLKNGSREMLGSDGKADIFWVLQNPSTWEAEAYCACYERRAWKTISPGLKPDFEALKKNLPGDFEILSRTQDDAKWIVKSEQDASPAQYFLYDRRGKKPELLMRQRASLAARPLARTRTMVLESRDGLKLVCYLTLPNSEPAAVPAKPLPMVLLVHGGPWARDFWEFNTWHQFLADRGYAVLSVNYRGSFGFGKKFMNAGYLEWGGKMHLDLVDAVNWAVMGKIADPDRIAIMGRSYGGYAALAGLCFTPDLFACGVDLVGPSNLITMLASIPPYWTAFQTLEFSRIGDPRTEEGRKLLMNGSPFYQADKIKKPLLVGQGANDPRVKQAESDRIVNALKDRGIPVTYALFPDEGHHFDRPENNMAFMALTEAFLKKHLGGEAEPVGKAFEQSTIRILEGEIPE